jgi:D-alanyl-D-alanine carboxypeptidase
MRARLSGRVRPTVTVTLAIALCFAAATPALAHDGADGVEADHAYAGDPLFPMTNAANLFPGHSPDTPTAMASTTKVMSLIVALQAVTDGVVSMDDDVTISQSAASQGGSSMTDDNGTPLQWLEVVSFEDLLFGMMIPSGNNATWAVAQHVAKAYIPNFGTVASFVAAMNSTAADLGLSSTHYENPVGWDHWSHWTTARDLARLWSVGMADTEFRRIVRPQTWVAQGVIGSTTKTYTLVKGGNSPGLEGHKNGISTDCSADQEECFVASARRIGRRVVVSGMQADGWVNGSTGDAAEVFNFAFARLFHPDHHGMSGLSNAANRLGLVCPTSGRAVTASLPLIGRTQLVSWNTSITAETYNVAGSATAPTGSLGTTFTRQRSAVDAIALSATKVVTATNVDTSVELRLWSVPAAGNPTSIGSVGVRTIGEARSIELVRLSSTMFASVARSTTDRLVLRIWRTSLTGLVLLKSVTAPSPATGVLEVDTASASGQQSLRFVTVIRREGALPLVQAWDVDAISGAVTGHAADSIPQFGTAFSIVPAPVEALPDEIIGPTDTFYAIGFRRSGGGFGMMYTRVGFGGTLGARSAVATAGTISAVELAPFGSSGIISLTRLANGTLKPIVWETRRSANGSVTGLRISDHATWVSGSQPRICATPTTKAEGDFITGLLEGSPGAVRIRGWRVGDRP